MYIKFDNITRNLEKKYEKPTLHSKVVALPELLPLPHSLSFEFSSLSVVLLVGRVCVGSAKIHELKLTIFVVIKDSKDTLSDTQDDYKS